jgi:UDP-2,4-diacetamido-2,4,6-trideoxy-beta-L-altropyranose hydrolase
MSATSGTEKRLVIRADASMQMGTGHLLRCLALAQAWKDVGGVVTFITACQNERLLARFHEEAFELHVIPVSYPEPDDWKRTRVVLEDSASAWVVLDGYHFDETYQRNIVETGCRLLVIDDRVRMQHYHADIILNQNIGAEQLHYHPRPYTDLLLGSQYVVLRREFTAWKEWLRDIPDLARKVLVTLGGSDPMNYTPGVIEALEETGLPGLEIKAVIGAGNPHAELIKEVAENSRLEVELIHDTRNMPELMAWADVAISGFGGTCWELAYMGLPALVVSQQSAQQENMRRLQESGIAFHLDLEHDGVSSAASPLLYDVLTSKLTRTAMSRVGRTIIDGHGTKRVMDALEGKRWPGVSDKETGLSGKPGREPKAQQGLKVVFFGGMQAGCVGLLAAIAAGCRVRGIVASDNTVGTLAAGLGIPVFGSVKSPEVEWLISKSDLLISVHCREILPRRVLNLPRLGGINVHPCLYRYKGARPVNRLLHDGCTEASVGVHRMTERVDEGEVLAEEFVDVSGKQSADEVYNALYPAYAAALIKALKVIVASEI